VELRARGGGRRWWLRSQGRRRPLGRPTGIAPQKICQRSWLEKLLLPDDDYDCFDFFFTPYEGGKVQ